MAEYSSTLTMRLIDMVTGPAGKVRSSLAGLDATARASTGKNGGITSLIAAGKGLIAAYGGFYLARGIRSTVTEFAELERRMTRIGITAGATPAATRAAVASLRTIADETALSIDSVTEGLETLVAQGRSLDEAMAFLPAVARTAQASGAEVADIANSAGAIGDAFKISGADMQKAFDILVAGGKAGKFELKDMAQYLPSLAPSMAALGYEGEAGLRKLVAALQIVRNQTGDASEAATNFANVLQKMEVDATAEKFSKFGVDLHAALDKARKDGRDLLDTFIDLTEQATKGDMSKIPQLFTDLQMQKGMRALVMQRHELEVMENSLRNVDGSTLRDLTRVLEDSESAIDRMTNSWETLKSSLGHLGAASGLPSFLQETAAELNAIAGTLDSIAGKGLVQGLTEGGPGLAYELFNKTPESEAYREAYKKIAGVEPPVEDAAKHSPIGADWLRRTLGVDVDAEIAKIREAAAADARKFLATKAGARTDRDARDDLTPAQRWITTTPAGEEAGEGVDYTRGAPGGFTTTPPGFEPGTFAPMTGRPPKTPMVEQAPALITTPPDLSGAGRQSMSSFREGLTSEMHAAEAEVDSFVARLKSKLAFSASPTINASINTTTHASVERTSSEQGKVADARLRGSFADHSLA